MKGGEHENQEFSNQTREICQQISISGIDHLLWRMLCTGKLLDALDCIHPQRLWQNHGALWWTWKDWQFGNLGITIQNYEAPAPNGRYHFSCCLLSWANSRGRMLERKRSRFTVSRSNFQRTKLWRLIRRLWLPQKMLKRSDDFMSCNLQLVCRTESSFRQCW